MSSVLADRLGFGLESAEAAALCVTQPFAINLLSPPPAIVWFIIVSLDLRSQAVTKLANEIYR